MFKDVLSIGGRPGIFKMVSSAKNYVIVESLLDKKRFPSYQNERISLLSDIVMYSVSGEKRIGEILDAAYKLENGGKISVNTKDKDALYEYLSKIFPDFDKERIYPNDIKKLVTWYNILIDNNITDFIEEEDNDSKDETVEEPKADAKPKSTDVEKGNKSPKTTNGKVNSNTTKQIQKKSTAQKQATRVAVKKG